MSYLGSEWLGGNDKRKEFIWNERMNVGIQYNRRIAQNGLNFFSLVEKKNQVFGCSSKFSWFQS